MLDCKIRVELVKRRISRRKCRREKRMLFVLCLLLTGILGTPIGFGNVSSMERGDLGWLFGCVGGYVLAGMGCLFLAAALTMLFSRLCGGSSRVLYFADYGKDLPGEKKPVEPTAENLSQVRIVSGEAVLQEDLEVGAGEQIWLVQESSLTIPEGRTLKIRKGGSLLLRDGACCNLSVESGAQLENRGSLTIGLRNILTIREGGIFRNYGELNNQDTIINQGKQEQKIFMTNPYQERDLKNGSRNTMSKVCTLKLGFAVEDPDRNLSYTTSDPSVAVVEAGKITYQGVGECVITVTAAATDLCKEAVLEIPVKVGSPVLDPGGFLAGDHQGFPGYRSKTVSGNLHHRAFRQDLLHPCKRISEGWQREGLQ